MRRGSYSYIPLLLAAAVILFLLLFGTRKPLRTWREAFRNFPGESHPRQRSREFPRREERAPAECKALGVECSSIYFGAWRAPGDGTCTTSLSGGYPIPDPHCTPGGIDPTVTAKVLKDRAWRTGCVRNCQTSEEEKHVAYGWYGLRTPRKNFGENQVCELDHLVPLELGGADGMGNIWPECGPSGVALQERYFKQKDHVENYLAHEVRTGAMALDAAQRGIAADWTQYLDAANRYCRSGHRCD